MGSGDAHSASSTLHDIIDELKLTYDSSVGTLDGDFIRKIPNVNVLQNLSKLLANLHKDLEEIERVDEVVLQKVNKALGVKDGELEEDGDSLEIEKESKSGGDSANRGVKRKDESQDDESAVEETKKRKLNDEGETSEEVQESDVKEGTENAEEGQDGEPDNDGNVPPVQTGSYTPGNDTRLKNPKSEFVSSQTLPADAIAKLGLFSEDNNGLETHGKEYLKKRYGVASYPENDLQDMLPGKIPDHDFSKTKPPSNQVQFTTFQSYIESYFRPFLNDDIKFLNESNIIPPGLDTSSYDPNISPYIIPKLGQFYADIWSEEDSTLGAKLNSPAYQQPPLDSYKPRGTIDDLLDENLYTEEISCGPFSSRLLSAILSAHEGKPEDDDESNDDSHPFEDDVPTKLSSNEDYKVTAEVNDFYSIEERLKRELKYIGIFMNLPTEEENKNNLKINGRPIKRNNRTIIDSDDWIRNKEDDEVCAEIRQLQKSLKEASARNRRNKKKLIPIIEEQLAWQEFYTILEELDKQIDQAYTKRLKAKNKKKKAETTQAQQHAANSGLRALLDKRKRWIENIGKLFKPPEIMKRVPKESILQGECIEEEGDDEENETEEALIQK